MLTAAYNWFSGMTVAVRMQQLLQVDAVVVATTTIAVAAVAAVVADIV